MLEADRFPIDEWAFIESQLDLSDEATTETLFSVGNGYLGLRGNHAEGRHGHEHGTFVNGFHETFQIRHAEQAFGFAEVGQTIVNAPDAKVMRVYVDDEPISLDVADIRDYERKLDFRTGVLTRRVLWQTPSGKLVEVLDERLVSFEERHLAVLSIEVTVLNSDAPVTISSQLLNRQDGGDVYGPARRSPEAGFDPRKVEQFSERVLLPQLQRSEGSRSVLSYRTVQSNMTIAVGVDHVIETENEYTVRDRVEGDFAKDVFRVQAKRSVPIRVTKFAAYHSSRGVPAVELIDRCQRSLDRAVGEGLAEIKAQQEQWLSDFWDRSDVHIGGQPRIQQAVRWCLFQLAQAAARADGRGVPAKGVSGSGYSGHYFWDTEIYVLPFLTYTTPLWARNALRMRALMLPDARSRARSLSEAGALFPWRTINGEEASAYYAAGTAQYHINADISYALAKYVRASGDQDFLYREGVDILVETARLWETLGFWRDKNDAGSASFHIHGVTGPDEYTTVVNDNLFTNVMARFNLRYAAETVQQMKLHAPAKYDRMVQRLSLGEAEAQSWLEAANAMHIPFSETLQIHPQDAVFLEREVWDLENTPPQQHPLLLHFHPLVIYRYQVLKQADVVLALFLQSEQFTDAEKLANFDYYDPLTTGDSTLSAVVQSILAAEVGYQDLALEYFQESVFVDLADLHSNAADGVHVASAGGVWSALVSGFGGMRDSDGQLRFDPRLPKDWSSLEFSLQCLQLRLRIKISSEQMVVKAEAVDDVGLSESLTFRVRGELFEIAAGQELEITLAGQGPVLSGRPSLRQFDNARREDGTLISASVPPLTGVISLPDLAEEL